MSARQLFSNNATTTLASPIAASDTSLSVSAATGALFPAPAGGEWFICTLVKNGDPTTYEIIKCTARSGDTFGTIVRAQEGTTAKAWGAGDFVSLMPTAGSMANFVQPNDLITPASGFAAITRNYAAKLAQSQITPATSWINVAAPSAATRAVKLALRARSIAAGSAGYRHSTINVNSGAGGAGANTWTCTSDSYEESGITAGLILDSANLTFDLALDDVGGSFSVQSANLDAGGYSSPDYSMLGYYE